MKQETVIEKQFTINSIHWKDLSIKTNKEMLKNKNVKIVITIDVEVKVTMFVFS